MQVPETAEAVPERVHGVLESFLRTKRVWWEACMLKGLKRFEGAKVYSAKCELEEYTNYGTDAWIIVLTISLKWHYVHPLRPFPSRLGVIVHV